MRVIKFRGKDKHTSKWVFGDLAHSKGVSTNGLYDRVMVGGYHVIPETIGQFTGLLDKNGREIYERDILLWVYEDNVEDTGYGEIYNEVSFQGGCFGQIGEITGELLPFFENKDSWIVAGNIHDNPELLMNALQKAGRNYPSVAKKSAPTSTMWIKAAQVMC